MPHENCLHRTVIVGGNRKLVVVGTIVCVLGGCAGGSGILPAGPDTYTLTQRVAVGFGGDMEAQRQVLIEANTFCTKQDRQFVPAELPQVQSPSSEFWNGSRGYSITFRCLLPSDPAVAKYHLEPAPNLVIEQRSR
jgi:hypothetical protein